MRRLTCWCEDGELASACNCVYFHVHQVNETAPSLTIIARAALPLCRGSEDSIAHGAALTTSLGTNVTDTVLELHPKTACKQLTSSGVRSWHRRSAAPLLYT